MVLPTLTFCTDTTQEIRENNDELSSLQYRIVPEHRNASPNNATIEDGKEWLDRELERIYNTESNDTSCHCGGVGGDHLSTGDQSTTVRSGRPDEVHDVSTTNGTTLQDANGSARLNASALTSSQFPNNGRLEILNSVLSTHLDTMGSDNEATNYMDRVARLSASSASASLAASSAAATAAAPASFPSSSSTSGHLRSSSGRCLGKRRRDSTDIGSETLAGGDCPTMPEDVDPAVSHDGGPDDEPSEKAKGKRPEGAISPRKKTRRREAINGYKKHMKTPEPFPHERPSVSFKKGYSENLAKTLTAVTQELEELQPLSTGIAAASTAVTADTTDIADNTATTDTAQPQPPVCYTQAPSPPPTRPQPALSASQAMPTATSMQAPQPMEVVPPMQHPSPMQSILPMLSLPPMPPMPVVSDEEMRSYQDMQALNAMRAIEDLQAMDTVQAMQGLPGMSGVADDIPLMPAIPIPDAMAHALQPMPPMPHGLPTPTYDHHNTINQAINHDAAYTAGYNSVPPPPSLVPAGHGGLHSPEVDDYIEVDDYFGVAAPMDMDFADPEAMHRFMSFCEELGTSHDGLDTTSEFPWI
ncbi:hypothetical protein SPBR_04770 [Sporothrix brasiliensis 5110]|uniref:Uncharacterized protein n=1 Tax=Sporothrix brasiliensis 5110 TaxID=1398154 RepID=A0A0C2IKH6_9PEZI|nr:uncharacterized protein SPBR_04770 [Sporothrix brasiliensis 5110]KIH87490.1 hypothetical protein SPBR_04770 [Sporothrix brasiliensis 5110]